MVFRVPVESMIYRRPSVSGLKLVSDLETN